MPQITIKRKVIKPYAKGIVLSKVVMVEAACSDYVSNIIPASLESCAVGIRLQSCM